MVHEHLLRLIGQEGVAVVGHATLVSPPKSRGLLVGDEQLGRA